MKELKAEDLTPLEYYEGLKQENKTILEDFYKKLIPMVKEIGRKYNIFQKDIIEDISRETNARIWENLHFGKFQFQGVHPLGYARMIAQNVILEYLRRNSRIDFGDKIIADEIIIDDNDHKEQEIKAEKAKLLNYAISTMNNTCKTMLHLTYWRNLESEEVATNDENTTNIHTDGGVRNSLTQCRERLRLKLIELNYFKL